MSYTHTIRRWYKENGRYANEEQTWQFVPDHPMAQRPPDVVLEAAQLLESQTADAEAANAAARQEQQDIIDDNTPPADEAAEAVVAAATAALAELPRLKEMNDRARVSWVPVVCSNPSFDYPLDANDKPDMSDVLGMATRPDVEFITEQEYLDAVEALENPPPVSEEG